MAEKDELYRHPFHGHIVASTVEEVDRLARLFEEKLGSGAPPREDADTPLVVEGRADG